MLETDYHRISSTKISYTINVDNTILLDIDKNGKIVGIETIGKQFSLEVALKILESFTYPEIITLPTGRPIMFKDK